MLNQGPDVVGFISFNLFSRLRAEVAGKLTFFLAHEENSLHKVPLFSELPLNYLTNLLLVQSPRQLEEAETSRSVFQVGVRQGWYNQISELLSTPILDALKSNLDDVINKVILYCTRVGPMELPCFQVNTIRPGQLLIFFPNFSKISLKFVVL